MNNDKTGGEPVQKLDKSKHTGLTKEKKAVLQRFKGKSTMNIKPVEKHEAD